MHPMLGYKLVAEVGFASSSTRCSTWLDTKKREREEEQERRKSSRRGGRERKGGKGRSVPASSRFLPPWPASRNRFTLLRPGVSVSGPLGGGRKGAGSGESRGE